MRRLLTLIVALALTCLAACTGGSGSRAGEPGTSAAGHRSGSAPVGAGPTALTPGPQTSGSQPSGSQTSGQATAPSGVPSAPAHVVVVMLENHSYREVVGVPSAPFLSGLAARGASFTDFRAITHPSEPNYLALFSGSTQGVTSDACPVHFDAPNLARSLLAANRSFTGFAEGLPRSGFTGCSSGSYARKHCPWLDFDLPASLSRPMPDFPSDYGQLPTVAFVVPDLQHDMHDGTVAEADAWLRTELGGYAAWASGHDSLLVVTADEDDGSAGNRIPAVVFGAHVVPGSYDQPYTLYSLLRTLEDMYRLPRLGQSANAAPITGNWR